MLQANPLHLIKMGDVLDRRVLLALVPPSPAVSDCSTVAVSCAVVRDGFESWKIHFMNLVDEFRRHHDVRLVLMPPISALDPRLKALLASIVYTVCAEVDLEPPEWSCLEYFLPKPWFVSGIESLKASTLVESPFSFRRNNIFVQENFLRRA
jgi:hypothetical protein